MTFHLQPIFDRLYKTQFIILKNLASLAQPACLAQAQEDSRDSEFSSNDSSSSEDKETFDPNGLGETSGTNDASEQ